MLGKGVWETREILCILESWHKQRQDFLRLAWIHQGLPHFEFNKSSTLWKIQFQGFKNITLIFRLQQLKLPIQKESFPPTYDLSVVPTYTNPKSRDTIVQGYDFILKVEDSGISLQHISSDVISELVPNSSRCKRRSSFLCRLRIRENGISKKVLIFLYWTLRQNKDKKSPLIRSISIGAKPLHETNILDATGGEEICCKVKKVGWGIDAYVMAYCGASVTVVEKNPIVYEMVKDALERAKKVERIVNDLFIM